MKWSTVFPQEFGFISPTKTAMHIYRKSKFKTKERMVLSETFVFEGIVVKLVS